MKLIVIKCPECNATVKVEADAEEVTCEYCGAEAQVQRRSGLLQRPKPLPARPKGRRPMPVAVEESGSMWWAWVLLALIPLGVAAPCVIGGVICTLEHYERKAPRWMGGGVLTRDLNGDGVHDIVGHRWRNEGDERVALLSALNGKSGEVLWDCDLGAFRGGMEDDPLGVADATLVRSDGAKLMGIKLRDGSIKWRRTLDENIKRICAGADAKTVNVLTADERLHPIAVADGKPGAAEKTQDEMCEPIEAIDPEVERPDLTFCKSHGACPHQIVRNGIEGMDAGQSILRPAEGVLVAMGNKHPGTRVPMLARYTWPKLSDQTDLVQTKRRIEARYKSRSRRARNRAHFLQRKRREEGIKPRVLWKVTLPVSNPLSAVEGTPEEEEVGLSKTVVAAAYEVEHKEHGRIWRLTAFTVAKGRRLWDVELEGEHDDPEGISVTPTHVVVSRRTSLALWDIKTGKQTYEKRNP